MKRSMFGSGRWLLLMMGSVACASGSYAAGRDSAEERIELEEVVVTGTRLRSSTEASALTVFDRALIEELGAASVPDLLRYLPQQPFMPVEGSRFGGAQFVELRGIGADMTLVLINGRRAVTSAPQIAFNAFDLNSMPISAVERIDVLADGASAVYGADAVGGVVNVVLKRAIDAPEVGLRYGTARDGAEEVRASLGAGFSTERFSAALSLDWLNREFLLGEARDRYRNQDYRRFGSVDQRSPNANPGNVTSRTTANLPGLPSRTAGVPEGSTGVGLTPEDFLETAGVRNLDSLARFRSIIPEVERGSAVLNATYDVSQSLSLFVEGLYTDRSSISQSPPSALNGTLVPATNPFNPFGVPVSSNFLLTGIGPQHSVVEADSLRAVAGARGQVGSFDWELSYLYSDETGRSWVENTASPAAVAAALAATDPAVALNPFQDGPGGSQALLDSLVAQPTVANYVSRADFVSGFMRGNVWQLPAGPLEVVLGGEYREESVVFDGSIFIDDGRYVSAAFAEASVPLIDAAMQIPAVRGLSVTVAARQDRYSDFGSDLNPQYTLVWQPVSELNVRVSYGTSFRPPSLFDLYFPRTPFDNTPVTDPRRNNEPTFVTVTHGGNPELEPVSAQSLTAGVTWSPSFLEGLRLSATYWRIELDDRVQTFTEQLVVEYESLFPERVVRAAPTPADVAAGLPGVIESVDSTRMNFGALETDGVDLDLRWSIGSSWGDWLPHVSATWVNRYEAGQAPGTPPLDRVDLASQDGSILSWRAVAGLAWQRNVWGAALTARYMPEYDDANAIGVRNGRIIEDQFLLDAQVSLDFRRMESAPAWLRGLSLQAGVVNLFDEEPPFAVVGGQLGYDLTQGDLRQRFGYINLSKRF